MLNRLIHFCLYNRVLTLLVLVGVVIWGISVSPFAWETGLPRDPVSVDAIPDIGENQQIVYTPWEGRSPQDVEDQVSYPLMTVLLGIPNVKDIRSSSIFGVSSIYIIFEEGVDFYESRTRILEKLNALPSGTLPNGVNPSLGPDATGLGQVYWYTLEGRDPHGNPTGGWEPQELRTIQDFYVKYGLMAAKGVSEVASIGGYVSEYQIDIDPNAMTAHGVTIQQIIRAVKESNLDIGARTIEYNRVEYMVRVLGYIKSISDLEKSVVAVRNHVPIQLKQVAHIHRGPAPRRGGLDKGGVEAVGGVVVARYGANPLETINHVKEKIEELTAGLPSKTLEDGTISKVSIIPFYDRSGLIKETLGTLESALTLQLLISFLVIILFISNLKASALVSSLLPIGVLMTFVMMKYAGVNANIVALSGIAIAIGVMSDVGIVFTESIIRHIRPKDGTKRSRKELLNIIYQASSEVSGAVLVALMTTIISFLPVFSLQAAEGKLFYPLAVTKTFAMLSALLIGVLFIPSIAYLLFSVRFKREKLKPVVDVIVIIVGIVALIMGVMLGVLLILRGGSGLLSQKIPRYAKYHKYVDIVLLFGVVLYWLSSIWRPLGVANTMLINILFTMSLVLIILGLLYIIVIFYRKILEWCLSNKILFLSFPVIIIVVGFFIWQNTGREFMPSLNEGSFLLMPTTMPHSSVEENIDMIALLDQRVESIPEVENVVGKWGRAESALDPAPISMFENVINYRSEYILDEYGKKKRFKTYKNGSFILKNGDTYQPGVDSFRMVSDKELIPDEEGDYFRQWRNHIKSPEDIWQEIIKVSSLPGLTSAPQLQPIETRLVMLQTGMRAPMGLKVYGPNNSAIEEVGLRIEELLKEVEGIEPQSVFADRIVGKPYLEIVLDRDKMARYGLSVVEVEKILSSAIGGMVLSTSVEGKNRFPIRVRYAREYRDSPEMLARVLIPTKTAAQVPLSEVADVRYVKGPQMIKGENTFLVGYVIFDKQPQFAETNVVQNAEEYLSQKIADGTLSLPAGVTYKFTGNYENEVRATKRLSLIVPITLVVIFLILYLQFGSALPAFMVFIGIFVAFSGGFLMIWLYGQDWFLNFTIAGVNMRDMFQVHPINMSVAVWVGFIALFGVATDDGVLVGSYLKSLFKKEKPLSREAVRKTVTYAGLKRVRPATMTTATTIIALLPVLSSQGKGADIMVPMAIPLFGGMLLQSITMFIVPVLYSIWKEREVARMIKKSKKEASEVTQARAITD